MTTYVGGGGFMKIPEITVRTKRTRFLLHTVYWSRIRGIPILLLMVH